ncbi:MAG: hypothetical protein HY208_03540 [Nitrospirae bacterium]|nr:hypothetical protein [Nitrospirota bacterium]
MVDQIVHANIQYNREAVDGGTANPGLLTVTVDAAGALSVYHKNLFLAGLRQDQLITREDPALRSRIVVASIASTLMPIASRVAEALGTPKDLHRIFTAVSEEWSRTVERLCIGLRRLGTGGAFLISPSPFDRLLDVTYRFPYQRLSSAAILSVLDEFYLKSIKQKVHNKMRRSNTVPAEHLYESGFAEADSQDRDLELTGAVRLVTSLASIDGLVLLTPSLDVVGFGVKINSSPIAGKVYDGADLLRRGGHAKTIDPSRFGTRHGSVLRYCRADARALGVIVSQDGQVRLVMTVKRRLALWDNVQLLNYEHDYRRYALNSRRARAYRNKHRKEVRLGYSPMPKTLEELLQLKTNITKGV